MNIKPYLPIPNLLFDQVSQLISAFIQELENKTKFYQNQVKIYIQSDLDLPQCNPGLNHGRSSYSLGETGSVISQSAIILDTICTVLQADFLLHIQYDPVWKIWEIVRHSAEYKDDRDLIYDSFQLLKYDFLETINIEAILEQGNEGVYKLIYDDEAQINKAYLLMSLSQFAAQTCDYGNQSHMFIYVSGVPMGDQQNRFFNRNPEFLNNIYAYLITSFYEQACQLYQLDTTNLKDTCNAIKAGTLDCLRSRYGFVSQLLYKRRFDLFTMALERIEIHFEPIFNLDEMCIHGWEALARDPLTTQAPIHLFKAAELWGFQFTVELDKQLLRKAIITYGDLLRKNPEVQTLFLQVNVYPETLMSQSYFDLLKALLQGGKKVISGRKLVLEISEKKGLPFCSENPDDIISMDRFKSRLAQYTETFGVKFGIDDFGVGHSSIHRFTALKPPYIKIDREILHQEPFDAVVRFIKEVVHFANPLNPSDIIVEGVDVTSPITLKRLKDLGVHFVQGYLIGKATPDIYSHLDRDKIEVLLRSLQDQRHRP